MSASDFSENLTAIFLFTTDSIATRPTTWFVSLHTADPGETGASTSEVTVALDTAYTRISVTFVTTGTPGEVKNSVVVTFPAANVVPANYTATHFGVWSALTLGNLLGSNVLAVGKLVEDGTVLFFNTNDLIVQVS